MDGIGTLDKTQQEASVARKDAFGKSPESAPDLALPEQTDLLQDEKTDKLQESNSVSVQQEHAALRGRPPGIKGIEASKQQASSIGGDDAASPMDVS